MKKILLLIIFILFTGFIYIYIENIIHDKQRRLEMYKDLSMPYETDILFIGTSRMKYGMSPMYIYHKYGVTSYNLGSDGQSYKISMQLLKKYKPNVAVIDIHILQRDSLQWNRYAFLSLFNIFDRFKIAKSIFGNEKYLDELNSFNLYHNRWENLVEYDFNSSKYAYNKGIDYTMIFKKNLNVVEFQDRKPIDKEKIHSVMDEIVNCANSIGTKVIFISHATPHKKITLIDEVTTYSSQKKYVFIDYNQLVKELDINYKDDTFDNGHMNIYGSYKIIDHLIPYIIENYNIPNRKNDPAYASWNEDYIKYARAVNKAEINLSNTFNDWYNLSQYDNYTMFISSNGDNVLNRLPQDMKDKFKSLGLTKYETNKGNMKYAAIIDNGKVFYEEVSEKKVEYKGRMKNIVNLLVSSENRKSTINVSGKPRSKNKYGLNFVIYDKVNREIVDSIWLDPANFNQVRR